MTLTKIIITSESGLRRKYGASGFKRIQKAVAVLVESDAARGITSRLLCLDQKAEAKACGARAAKGVSLKSWKVAVDAACLNLAPDYVMLLGNADVVPQQLLSNPLAGDGDRTVASDLPYACAASFSKDVCVFLSPSRIVGRLPDLFGASEVDYLEEVLATAAKAVPKAKNGIFAVSASAWAASTRATVQSVHGAAGQVYLSPAEGPKWTQSQVAPRIHLINCHGAEGAPAFYGDDASGNMPAAVEAGLVLAQSNSGAVVAAECCYGAELYDPSIGPPMGTSQAYLRSGCYGFLGSSTIAYGPPATPNSHADLICGGFLKQVLLGGSTGAALLDTRIKFVRDNTPLDPVALKTLAQFNLLGDPSIRPVSAAAVPSSKAPKSLRGNQRPARTTATEVPPKARLKAAAVLGAKAVGTSRSGAGVPAVVRSEIKRLAELGGFKASAPQAFSSRATVTPKTPHAHALRSSGPSQRGRAKVFYVSLGKVVRQGPDDRVQAGVVYIATEAQGKVVVRELQRKLRNPR